MTRTKILPLFAILCMSFILAVSSREVTGRANDHYFSYLPVVLKPPEAPAWIGPDGGFVIAVAVAPSQTSTIYAGTWGSGIYKSTDSGATWVWKSQGLGHPFINSLAIDPHNAQIVYAGTYKGKVYKSIDGGENWFQSSTNIQEDAIVYSIVIDSLDSENIFIGTRGLSNDGGPPWNGVLYRSTDAGNTWVPKLTDVGGSAQEDWVYSVTLHPRYPHLVFAATHEHGIYRSLDFGKHWEPVNAGITSMSTRGIVVNPGSSEMFPTLYTGVWKWEGVFRSNNGGLVWFQENDSSHDTRIYSLSINPQAGSTVYAATFSGGVLKTSDGGRNWSIVGLEDYEVPTTAVDPEYPGFLYAGTNGNGLYKSTDAGDTWKPSQNGLHATQVNAFQVSPTNLHPFYAAPASEGVKYSSDGGQTWNRLGSDLSHLEIYGLEIPPHQPQIILALTSTDGLYRCNLQGTCWEKVQISLPLSAQFTIEAGHPFWKPALQEELSDPSPMAVMGTPALLALKFSPSNSQIAFLGTSSAGVYKSVDGGHTWSPSGLSNHQVSSLAIDLNNPNLVYAASSTQVWSSANGGGNWTDTGLSGVNIYALAVDQAGNLYAGTSNGIYQRAFAGWAHLGLAGLPVTDLIARPDKIGWLYAGTSDGLHISRDAGQTWDRGPAELNGITVRGITFNPTDPSYIFVSTQTQGVLRLQDWK